MQCSHHNVISLQSRPLNFRVIIHAYSLLPQTYLRSSSLTRYLGKDHLVFVGEGGVGTYQIKVLRKKFKRKKKIMRKKVPEKKIQACVLVEFVHEQVFKNTRKNRSGESGADIYNHLPRFLK